jgi:hypothetical protein
MRSLVVFVNCRKLCIDWEGVLGLPRLSIRIVAKPTTTVTGQISTEAQFSGSRTKMTHSIVGVFGADRRVPLRPAGNCASAVQDENRRRLRGRALLMAVASCARRQRYRRLPAFIFIILIRVQNSSSTRSNVAAR